MSDPEDHLAADRANRMEALARVTNRFSALKGAFAEKGVGQRVGELATGKAKSAAHEAVDVARDAKGVVAGAAGLLALWALRRPIAGQVRRWWPLLKARMGKEKDQ
ncbi:hypothetical protein [Novosphingobium sp. TH158]|uniref:hypothetical protein n=1 Tax=Novosphingobium sp. TH158 TaxID=2067455 RepID=UPI000C7B3645|nr:hypothetical protein [Novosphingobium sp. TH158]PLK25970.1 hypothetical protein C0V78_02995 [Novosphingobium sp. TH158]